MPVKDNADDWGARAGAPASGSLDGRPGSGSLDRRPGSGSPDGRDPSSAPVVLLASTLAELTEAGRQIAVATLGVA
jgi:hypothetical protein